MEMNESYAREMKSVRRKLLESEDAAMSMQGMLDEARSLHEGVRASLEKNHAEEVRTMSDKFETTKCAAMKLEEAVASLETRHEDYERMHSEKFATMECRARELEANLESFVESKKTMANSHAKTLTGIKEGHLVELDALRAELRNTNEDALTMLRDAHFAKLEELNAEHSEKASSALADLAARHKHELEASAAITQKNENLVLELREQHANEMQALGGKCADSEEAASKLRSTLEEVKAYHKGAADTLHEQHESTVQAMSSKFKKTKDVALKLREKFIDQQAHHDNYRKKHNEKLSNMKSRLRELESDLENHKTLKESMATAHAETLKGLEDAHLSVLDAHRTEMRSSHNDSLSEMSVAHSAQLKELSAQSLEIFSARMASMRAHYREELESSAARTHANLSSSHLLQMREYKSQIRNLEQELGATRSLVEMGKTQIKQLSQLLSLKH
jgi:hypothetical protein